MRLLIQRVKTASVTIDKHLKSAIGEGLLVFVGVEEADTDADIDYCVRKMLNLRIFNDNAGVMNCSLLDIEGELLVVSQFTLMAATAKGNRPSYIRAARPDFSKPMYERFCQKCSEMLEKPVATGEFGADMQVSLVNDGPVTIWIDSKTRNY